MTASAAHQAVEAVWRIESTKVIAVLARYVRDISLAEDLANEALVVALEQWPSAGIPDSPSAWLITAAKRRAIDQFRRQEIHSKALVELAHRAEADSYLSDFDSDLNEGVDDDVLRLIFIACHPFLSMDARACLTLRLVGGLTTSEIAKAYVTPEATISQRILRAKRKLAEHEVPFEVPARSELRDRLASVLEVVYLTYNEGYAATSGDYWVRPALCRESLRLGRKLTQLLPGESEVFGLVALMEIQTSRLPARTGPSGEPILLRDQDRSRWDRPSISRGLAALDQANSLRSERPDIYTVQAEIAACHARAESVDTTDWRRIVEQYEALALAAPSPIVDLNRAVALAMVTGPEAGLALVNALDEEGALDAYHLLPSVKGDLLERIGHHSAAEAQFHKAASLTGNLREQALLTARADRARELANGGD